MEFLIPEPLKAEHAELHAELEEATRAGGRVGKAAKEVAKRLHPHFVREEELALPPLGLLAPLAQGAVSSGMVEVLALTGRLEAALPSMLIEHKEIVAALGDLVAAAKAENQPQHARFAEKLMLHARTEEEVLYPAAILVGRYVKRTLGK
jgi:hemerythrin HHE cation binding domain-containing protein